MTVDRRIPNSSDRILSELQQRTLRLEQRLYPLPEEQDTEQTRQITFLLPGAVTDDAVGPWVAPGRFTIAKVVLSCITYGASSGATVDVLVNGAVKDTVTMGASTYVYEEAVAIPVTIGDRITVQCTAVDSSLLDLSVGLRWG